MTTQAVVLFCFLLIGHFLGDFTPLSTPRMLEAKANGGPIWPIAQHAGVHAILTGIAVLAIAQTGAALAGLAFGVQFTTHLALDGARSWSGTRRPALNDPTTNAFWTALGLDQLSHTLVLVVITLLVL